jgi:SARP family transcriptional regulator, regulator of embCAB operon
MSGLSFAVLGPLEVRRDGELLALGGPKQRAVLGILLLEANRVVPASRIAELVWGDDAPDGVQGTLQVYVSNLRRILRGADDSEAGPLVGRRPGYLLEVEESAADHLQVAQLLASAREHRAGGDRAASVHLLRLALQLWRGPVLADLRDRPEVAALTMTLDRQRSLIRHECFEAELDLGRHRQLLPELADAVAEEPHDERLAALLVLALYRSGRQGDALATYRRTAARLVEELGIDPGPELRALEESVLRQDPALDLSQPDADPGVTVQRDDRGQRGAVLVLPNGVELELQARTWVIGRHPECQVVLADPEASRRHAEVRPIPGGYVLVDLGSTNGTRVGEEQVREHRLVDGEQISVGSTVLLFRAG